MKGISIIIPANNEEGYIGECLGHVLGSEDPGTQIQVLVVANGCRDNTVGEAAAMRSDFETRGWVLDVLDLAKGQKVGALNSGDRAANFDARIYLDADIHISKSLMNALARLLERPGPVFAGGRPRIRPARSWISERYARFWERLPFMSEGVPGNGVFGVNAQARAKWEDFPEVIADDTFVRYQFEPHEMFGCEEPYSWPITEGFANLVRVRRRQDEGLQEIRQLYPDLAARMAPTAPTPGRKIKLLFQDPIGFVIYVSVAVAVRLPIFKSQSRWHRGR